MFLCKYPWFDTISHDNLYINLQVAPTRCRWWFCATLIWETAATMCF